MAMKRAPAKSSFKELTDRPEARRHLEQELLLVSAAELVSRLLEEKKVSRAELAGRIGKSKAFVTQILRGSHNMTLRTLADLAWALDTRVQMSHRVRDTGIQTPTGGNPRRRNVSRLRRGVRLSTRKLVA